MLLPPHVLPPARRPLLDLRPLLLILLLLRASCDPWLDALKGEAGGMGLGAVLNGALLLVAARYALVQPGPLLRVVAPMWGPFLLLGLASLSMAPDWAAGLRLLLVQISYAAAFALPLWLVRQPRQLLHWLRVLLLSSLVPVASALADLVLQRDPQGDGLFRVQGSFNHPNILAFYLLLMLTILLYLLRTGTPPPQRLRPWLWAFGALLALLLAFTKTRSAWAGAALMLGLYGLLAERRSLVVLLLASSIFMLDDELRARVLDVTSGPYDQEGNLNSYAWRVLMWQSALAWMEGLHWVVGYGLEAFRHYSPQFFPLEGRDSWDPHNTYVHVLFELGSAGLLAYLWLFWRLLRTVLAAHAGVHWRRRVLLGATIAAYLLTAYSDNLLYYLSFNWYFWFFIGCAVAERQPCWSPT